MILTLLSTAVDSLLGGLGDARWTLWKYQHHQTFQGHEDSFRKAIFLNNFEMVEKHNSDTSATFKMALNHFAALTADQFQALYLNKPSIQSSPSTRLQAQQEFKVPQNLKGDINWNAAGYVTAVKNQGQCASGYAFGVTGALQFFYKQKTNNLISLSEQQIVDCDTLDQGCNGGFVVNGLNYTRVVGLASATTYPYIASKQICKSTTPIVKNTNLITVTECQALYNALQNRTVAVMVDARNFQFYSSGVFNNCTSSITHGLLLVGVATNSYWYVKNEWTTSWGEYGYIRIAWGNTCGICSYGAYPL